jgi:hypothetical protein
MSRKIGLFLVSCDFNEVECSQVSQYRIGDDGLVFPYFVPLLSFSFGGGGRGADGLVPARLACFAFILSVSFFLVGADFACNSRMNSPNQSASFSCPCCRNNASACRPRPIQGLIDGLFAMLCTEPGFFARNRQCLRNGSAFGSLG